MGQDFPRIWSKSEVTMGPPPLSELGVTSISPNTQCFKQTSGHSVEAEILIFQGTGASKFQVRSHWTLVRWDRYSTWHVFYPMSTSTSKSICNLPLEFMGAGGRSLECVMPICNKYLCGQSSPFRFMCLSLARPSPSKTNSFISFLLQGGQTAVIDRTSSGNRISFLVSHSLWCWQLSLPPQVCLFICEWALVRSMLPAELSAAPEAFSLSLASAPKLLKLVSLWLGSSGFGSDICS